MHKHINSIKCVCDAKQKRFLLRVETETKKQFNTVYRQPEIIKDSNISMWARVEAEKKEKYEYSLVF